MSKHVKLVPHFPIKIFLYFWIGMFVLRNFGFMHHEPITFDTYVLISLFCISFLVGYYLYFSLPFEIKLRGVTQNSSLENKNLKLLVRVTIILSLICCFTQLLKLQSFANLYSVEGAMLEVFSEIRRSTTDDQSYKLGSNIYGVISNILYGFPVLSIFIYLFYKEQIDKTSNKILVGCFFLGLLISFTNGGRFTAFSFALMYFFGQKIYLSKLKKSMYKRILFLFLALALFYVFGQMFITRLGSSEILMDYLEMQEFNKPKSFAKEIVNTFPALSVLVQIIMVFDYYITHSIDQLNFLYNSPYPMQAPYFGAYQFSTFVLLLNKLGFDIKTIDVISNEIVNPGVYFTMIGGVYLDYGHFGVFLFTLLFGFLTARSFSNFLKNKNLTSGFWSSIYLVILSISPIISMIGTGYFSSVITAGLFLLVFDFFFPLPHKVVISK